MRPRFFLALCLLCAGWSCQDNPPGPTPDPDASLDAATDANAAPDAAGPDLPQADAMAQDSHEPDAPAPEYRDPPPPLTEVPPRRAPEEGPVRAWILLSDDLDKVARHLERAPDFGVQELHLSHDLIHNIDDAPDHPSLRQIIEQAHQRGLRVLIWSNELNQVPFSLCFDPEDPTWAQRQQAYRDALEAAPELDGVILSFGSATPPPWLAGCLCQWCLDIPSDAGPVERPFVVPSGAWRLRFLINLIHNVVTGEYGKRLYARTFIHEPEELALMLEGFSGVEPQRQVTPVTKDVPNDWQPYYPLHPGFSALAARQPVMELDAAGEYWGQAALPWAAPGYFERRIRAARRRGALGGYAVRVERGGNAALDTPNEVNLYAIARFFEDPEATPAQVWRAWLSQRHGLPLDDPRLDELARVYGASFDIGRKMYYQLGFWTLEKSSGLPERCLEPGQLQARRNSKWDPAWEPAYQALLQPDVATLAALRQEDEEALELARRNLEALEALRLGGLEDEALLDLRRRLEKQRDALPLWMETVEASWATRLWRQSQDPQHAAWAASARERLGRAADHWDQAWGQDSWPVSTARARSCMGGLDQALPEGIEPQERAWPRLSAPQARYLPQEEALQITVQADGPMRLRVQWGQELPTLQEGVSQDTSGGPVTLVQPLPPGAPLWVVYRVVGEDAQGRQVQGSDWWVRRGGQP